MYNSTGKYSFTGNINIYLPNVGQGGSDVKAFNSSYQIIMQNHAEPNLSFSSVSGNADYRNKNAVQILGGYGLINTGGASGPQTVYMTFNDSTTNGAKALVTTFRLMPDNISDYLNLEYTLIDKDGNETLVGEFVLKNIIYVKEITYEGVPGDGNYQLVKVTGAYKEGYDKDTFVSYLTWDDIEFIKEAETEL